jgi:hypothetical protein
MALDTILIEYGFDKLEEPLKEGFHFFSGLKNLYKLLGVNFTHDPKYLVDDTDEEDANVFHQEYFYDSICAKNAFTIAKSIAKDFCGCNVYDEYIPSILRDSKLEKLYPRIERWTYDVKFKEPGEKIGECYPLGMHYDDFNAVSFETITIIFYLKKDTTTCGGRLLIYENELTEPKYLIEVETNSVLVLYGNILHSVEPLGGTGIRDCVVVQIPRFPSS